MKTGKPIFPWSLNYIIFSINLLVLCLLIVLFFRTESELKSDNKVYINNQQVYEAFGARADLNKKIAEVKRSNQQQLDSLRSLTNLQPNNIDLQHAYETAQISFLQYEEVIKERYQQELWQQINLYIDQFGQKNNYDFIFGANGNGSLMFANNTRNVTKELINYINDQYENKP